MTTVLLAGASGFLSGLWRPHAAAQTASNVQGTENLLRAAAAAGVQGFMHTSSVSAWSSACIGGSSGRIGRLTPGRFHCRRPLWRPLTPFGA